MKSYLRLLAAVATSSLILAACGGGQSLSTNPVPTAATGADTTTTVESNVPPAATSTVSTLPDGPSALDAAPDGLSNEGFPTPLIDTERLLQGQVPDGIPSIDLPLFVDVNSADDWLSDDEPVVVLEIDGDVRAYPVQILIWHEIVNDVVGEVPVAITYCPLCNSAVTYERRIDGESTTFGTSGFLYNSALVMYDRATESLWTHFDGTAVAGLLTGERLEPISSPLLAWAEFRRAHPDGRVLDVERTGHNRDYGFNPYVGYDSVDSFPFLFDGEVDDRAPAKQRVVGASIDGTASAWTLEEVSGPGPTATHGLLADTSIVILWKPGQSSALDASGIDAGKDVGSVGVYRANVGEQALTLEGDGDGFRDAETGSTWNVLGEALSGPLSGERLEPVPHLDTFWFAWLSYNPATDLVGG